MVYLDYAASTIVDKEVLDVFYETTLKYYGNPNSMHKLGRESSELISKCTDNITKNLGVMDSDVIYTSGATEANNLVIKGIGMRYKSMGKHMILSALEHSSLMSSATVMQELGFEVDILPVKKNGLVDIDELKKMIRSDTILVSVCAVDSELGLVQPIEEIGLILKDYPNTFFHTDATQAIGKVSINLENVDLVTFAPHKFYGLDGIGVLLKKKNVFLKPIINGGRSTTVFRSGTPNVASIVALDKALSIALEKQEERYQYVKCLASKLLIGLKKYDFVHVNNTDLSIPFIINFSVQGVKATKLVQLLDENEIYVSTKTSCCPVEGPSKLVYALTKDKGLSNAAIRVSLSHLTKDEDIDEFLEVFDICVRKIK